MHPILTVTLNPSLDVSTEAPEVVPDVKLRCAAPRFDAGGGGVNVSRAIAHLGGSSTAAVALTGATGQRVRSLLRAEALELLDLSDAADLGAETRECFSVICNKTGRQYRFVPPGQDWTPKAGQGALETLRAAVGSKSLVVLSGSLPKGLPPEWYGEAARSLSDRGARTILDTSGKALLALCQNPQSRLDVLRMDHDEARTVSGAALSTIAETAAFASQLVTRGVAKSVIVAKGAEGSVLCTAETGGWHARPPEVPVLSKTGAGDSFVAGFVLALTRGADLVDACVSGVGAAASAVTTPATALCTASDAEAFAKATTLKRL